MSNGSALFISIISAAAAILSPAAAETYTVYLLAGNDTPLLRSTVQQILPTETPETECRYVEISAECKSREEAEVQAQAMEAGVTHLPSLVIADEQGPYAALPLHNLSAENVQKAHELSTAENREIERDTRSHAAALYLLCAACAHSELTGEQVAELIAESRNLLEHELSNEEHKQFIGLRCLYPLLMLQYTQGYQGAHTPATEAKLLEAIAALEAARDLNKDSRLGRQAHEERERLRMARREARKYE
ncbi:MAG: hypothetical protein IKJ58_08665 [Akkermansia sp.]|nr:hypothetical protein [Akkermansia sp.]